jgi:alpha-N-arabinofuranosidase
MKRLSAIVAVWIAFSVTAQPQTITATIDAGKTRAPINKYLYGQFIEHLGNIINGTFWAEMLDDRKFYNPVVTHAPPATAPTTRARFFRPRPWISLSPEQTIGMDSDHPYTGLHAPLVKLDGSTPRGIRQEGIAVRKGKAYSGHIVLAGDGAKVIVSLIWGPNAEDRQTNETPKLADAYAEFPLNFTAGADTEEARLEIAGTGHGWFRIGVASLIPTDNIKGFRPEVIDALKQLHSGVYRFPGGNYISNYEWRDAIGDRDKRPPSWDYAWNVLQPNDVGLDEFMVLFDLLGVDPYISVNAGFGDAHSAAQLVEYANGSADTPMGKLRAANGHSQPYGIKLWGIGNEMYGDWQLGVMPLNQYEIKHNLFAAAMRRADPSIRLIASGAMPDEMTVTLQGKRINGNVLTKVLSPADWTGGMLSHCLENIDMVSEHAYCTSGQGFDIASGRYVDVDESLAEWVRRPANRVRAKYEAYQEYLNQISALRAKPVPISLDEYSYRRAMATNYKPAMAYAAQFHEMFRHTDVFKMAAFTFATSCLSANRTQVTLNPVGLVFKLYRDHFGELPVEIVGNSPQPAPKYPIGGDQPNVNAGGDTYPLDICAALSSDHKSLTLAVVNPTESAQNLAVSFKSIEMSGKAHVWRMAPSSVNASIVIGREPEVQIEDQQIDNVPGTLSIAPISVNIFEFPAK